LAKVWNDFTTHSTPFSAAARWPTHHAEKRNHSACWCFEAYPSYRNSASEVDGVELMMQDLIG
jgi:hypothetical protein